VVIVADVTTPGSCFLFPKRALFFSAPVHHLTARNSATKPFSNFPLRLDRSGILLGLSCQGSFQHYRDFSQSRETPPSSHPSLLQRLRSALQELVPFLSLNPHGERLVSGSLPATMKFNVCVFLPSPDAPSPPPWRIRTPPRSFKKVSMQQHTFLIFSLAFYLASFYKSTLLPYAGRSRRGGFCFFAISVAAPRCIVRAVLLAFCDAPVRASGRSFR